MIKTGQRDCQEPVMFISLFWQSGVGIFQRLLFNKKIYHGNKFRAIVS